MMLVAHNIRSLYNVGSIFRNAAAFGVEKLYLTGYTAAPPRKEIAKVALGAQDLVVWEKTNFDTALKELKDNGYQVWGLENDDSAIDIKNLTEKKQANIALVLGNEVEGLDKETIEKLAGTVKIPMARKKSLNVAVASGVAIYVLTQK
ncbi:TrmH family RNA methyltransferase [Candidatus Parcubacteria bacterium]|nr:MAG: TrmH family RNA methyltransferase [Candidatus Parcubacteria bacterium]